MTGRRWEAQAAARHAQDCLHLCLRRHALCPKCGDTLPPTRTPPSPSPQTRDREDSFPVRAAHSIECASLICFFFISRPLLANDAFFTGTPLIVKQLQRCSHHASSGHMSRFWAREHGSDAAPIFALVPRTRR
jgi:hypothetical protein